VAVEIDLLIRNGQVVTAAHGTCPVRGRDMQELEVIERGWVACAGERIAAVGPREVVGEPGGGHFADTSY